MISARKLAANRANARKSTGPRSALGKARAARNAWRHGLTKPILQGSALSSDAKALARLIAGTDASAERYEAACRIAEAQIAFLRVGCVRRQLMAELERHTSQKLLFPDVGADALVRRLAALDRYDNSARMQRRKAIHAFDAGGSAKSNPPDESAGSNSAKTNPTSETAHDGH